MKATLKRTSRNLKIALVSSIILGHCSAFASELSISDKRGSSYVRVEASDANSYDVKVVFKNTSSTLPNGTTLSLTSKVDDSVNKIINLKDSDLTQGVVVSQIEAGSYTLSLSTQSVEIKEVKVLDSQSTAKASSDDSDVNTAAYAIGAAAVGGAALAVSAGSDSDIFSGSSRSNTARTGSGTNTGGTVGNNGASAVAGQAPDVGALTTPDSNFPVNNPGYDAAPDSNIVKPVPNPREGATNPPPAAGIATPTPTPALNPTPSVAPPIATPTPHSPA